MPLVTNFVEVGVNGSASKHYEDIGYFIPRYKNISNKYVIKRGTKIIVWVGHLTKGAVPIVKVECPKCLEVREKTYKGFLESSDICYKCTNKINGMNQAGKKNPMYGLRGKNHPAWKEVKKCDLQMTIRTHAQNKLKRLECFERDQFKCQCCGDSRGGNLVAHHITSLSNIIKIYGVDKLNFLEYSNKLFDVDNLITLCSSCHVNFHNSYTYGNNTKKQLREFLDG